MYQQTWDQSQLLKSMLMVFKKKAYMTLLSKEKQSGPFGVYETQNDDSRYFGDYGPQEVWQAFVDYKDVVVFISLQYFQLCVDYFQWTYYPPDEFKVLFIFLNQILLLSVKKYTKDMLSIVFIQLH